MDRTIQGHCGQSRFQSLRNHLEKDAKDNLATSKKQTIKNMEKENKKYADTDKVLEITEWFDASPERVFKAWTNKKDLLAWYGP
jgi:hypothetical protein